jgi:dGTPase
MLLEREKSEESEERRLAPYATRSRVSRGRRYPEQEHRFRTAFQRDRDRIVHTTAFRRLEYKTQVFVYYEGDYYRTRLTHTIETAQIGRVLARALQANEDLVEAIALAHDLGHPPFGHAGEEALQELMAEHGGFDHNLQGLRIVEILEQRYPEFPGLNLCWEVREGIAKHTTEHDHPRSQNYEPELLPSLEAQIVSAADEIAFLAHDLDDGLRSEMLQFEAVTNLSLTAELGDLPVNSDPAMTRHLLIRRLIDLESTDVILETQRRLSEVSAERPEDVRGVPCPMVAFSRKAEEENQELKELLWEELYRHYRVVRMAEKAKRTIRSLFTAYMDQPSQLPRSTEARAVSEDLARVTCDYIAGMTDRFALEEHGKLFDPSFRA